MRVVGYIASDSFRHGYVTHQVQNQAIRHFLSGQGREFLLSWSEFKGQAPLVLRSLLQEKFYQGICFYSLEQLEALPDPLTWFSILGRRADWVGFAREECFFTTTQGWGEAERLFCIKSQLDRPRPDLGELWAR